LNNNNNNNNKNKTTITLQSIELDFGLRRELTLTFGFQTAEQRIEGLTEDVNHLTKESRAKDEHIASLKASAASSASSAAPPATQLVRGASSLSPPPIRRRGGGGWTRARAC
jgi:FtsZ-binding cell division protein ZapB